MDQKFSLKAAGDLHGILKPKLPNQFWVNPALFFKGDMVAFMRESFMREYRIKGRNALERSETGAIERSATP
jgi:hypothetical protein